MVAAYEENLVCLIKDIRRAWKARPAGGHRRERVWRTNQKIDRHLGIIAAQHGAADREEFKGTAASVETVISSAHANNPPADKAITGTTTPKPTSSAKA